MGAHQLFHGGAGCEVIVRRLVLPGVGHLVLEEARDVVARAMLDFLPGTDRRP